MFDKEKLKQAMNDHGDTNKALAVFLGMTASNFSTIWNGRQPFQRKHIVPDRGPVSTLPAGRVGYILPGRC